jgi:hypothetical protein
MRKGKKNKKKRDERLGHGKKKWKKEEGRNERERETARVKAEYHGSKVKRKTLGVLNNYLGVRRKIRKRKEKKKRKKSVLGF